MMPERKKSHRSSWRGGALITTVCCALPFVLGTLMMMVTFQMNQILVVDQEASASNAKRARRQQQQQQQRLLLLENNNEVQAPFLHGVASFDPTSSAVIIWTRVSSLDQSVVTVNWQLSSTMDFSSIVASGNVNTNANQDYTVHVDVTGLSPSTYYYYKFTYNLVESVTGRTKTAPTAGDTSSVSQVRFATVSCANLQLGYFHAYDRIAERDDIDVVLHLGDYIYEHGVGGGNYPGNIPSREHDPPHETVTLTDYRTRYAQYRSENPGLMKLHQVHPLIKTWDDHEFADDAYSAGAAGHDPETQGSYIERRNAAAQANQEWLPSRITNQVNPYTFNLYRKLQYGDLVDLFVLDTRIVGRDEQGGLLDRLNFLPGYYNQDRDLLGSKQMDWLKNGLSTSTAQWKVLMQPIMLSPFMLGPLVLNEDAWDGYHGDRAELLGYIDRSGIDNVVVLSGDMHNTYMANVPKKETTEVNEWDHLWNKIQKKKDESIAVEFVTTSVSSPTPEEALVSVFSPLFGITTKIGGELWQIFGKNGLFTETKSHGYQIVDFQAEKVQSNIYFTGPPRDETDSRAMEDQYETSFFSLDGDNFLQQSNEESVAL